MLSSRLMEGGLESGAPGGPCGVDVGTRRGKAWEGGERAGQSSSSSWGLGVGQVPLLSTQVTRGPLSALCSSQRFSSHGPALGHVAESQTISRLVLPRGLPVWDTCSGDKHVAL